MQPSQQPTLYDRLGGVYSIATVVDDLIDRVMADAKLNANPLVEEAHHRVPPAGFKYLVTEMVCWAAGGPQKYSGKPMAESHQHGRDKGAGGCGLVGQTDRENNPTSKASDKSVRPTRALTHSDPA